MNTEVCAGRLARLRGLMGGSRLDYLVVGPSADLLYLLGSKQRTSERLALLVVSREGSAYMALPTFEATSLPALPDEVRVETWGESDNPAGLVADLIRSGGGEMPGGKGFTIGVSDRIWAVFLLQLQDELPGAVFVRGASLLSALRQIKTTEEIGLLRQSGAAADEAFSEIVKRPFAGRTEVAIAREIASLLEARGLDVEGLPIVASGPNSASPHHHTGSRVLEKGDMVVLDFGGTLQGYYSDITRMVFVGEGPQAGSEEERVYKLVVAAQESAVKAARPGMTCQDLDSVARDYLSGAGYGQYFTHRLGHGIGLDGHEPPYLVQGNDVPLRGGMAFSIEPGLYLPGKFGVRIEDTVVLHEEGVERLNNASKDIVVVS